MISNQSNLDIKQIYIIRHGQTDFNLQHIVQGRGVDTSLNETGNKQANAFFEAFKKVEFDLVLSSTLKRSKETIDSFINKGIPHRAMAELDEISWGDYEGIKPNRETRDAYLKITNGWLNGDLHLKTPNGESAVDLQNRQQGFIDFLAAGDYKKLLVCSHGRAIRALMCTIFQQDLSKMDEFPHKNVSLNLIEKSGAGYKLILKNDVTHLQSL